MVGLLLGVSLGALLISSTLSWLQFRRAFQHQIFDHLTSVRSSKGKQLELYLDALQGHIATLSEDRMVVAAMVDFNANYRELQNLTVSDEQLNELDNYYEKQFLPALSENVESAKITSNYRPTTQSGQYLQLQYLVRNQNDEPSELDEENGGRNYSATHAQYHPLFSRITQEFGYPDLYLIDFSSGDVVYSVEKRPDYATSLSRGPHRLGNLANVVEAVRNDPGPGFVQVADYQPYVPTYSAPAAFFAAPIYNGPHIVGILAVQLPTAEINARLTGDREWEEDGLGETGQVYVVGEDFLMRSPARTLLTDADTYQENLQRLGISPQTLNLIEKLNTSILLHPIETDAVKAALEGEIETQVVDNYRGIQVLSSYAPLRLDGLRWVILAEMDRAEAFGPVTALQIYMSISGVILILLIAWLANFAAERFVSPIVKLLDVTDKIQAGERDLDIEIGSDGKLDQLEDALQGLLQELKTQELLVAEKASENEALLLNMVPPSMASRVTQGDRPITETLQQVTLVIIRMTGLHALPTSQQPTVLESLVETFDQKAQRHGLETQATLDDTFIATCGISQVFLDQQERAVNFALDLLHWLETEGQDLAAILDLQIGIHSGPVLASVVGTTKFMYKLWGDTITIAMELNQRGGASNSILVTQPIQERLKDRFKLVPRPPVMIREIGPISAWMIFTPTGEFTQQLEQVQASLKQLSPQIKGLADTFYNRLYNRSPELGTLVKAGLTDPPQQFSDTLTSLVQGLIDMDSMVPMLQSWGRHPAIQGLQHTDYATIEAVLLWSLEKVLGNAAFTPTVKQAWQMACTLWNGVMQEAAVAHNVDNTLAERHPVP
ncbi:MAG: adenylate/guanylate cyclase domain-containing protein [Cyanobacteria bacterium P01_F01_bin.53]